MSFVSYIHETTITNQDTEYFSYLPKFPGVALQSLPSSIPGQAAFCYMDYSAFYMNGIIQYVLFCVCLLELSMMVLRFIHVLAYSGSSVLFVAD